MTYTDPQQDVFNLNDSITQPRLTVVTVKRLASQAAREVCKKREDRTVTASQVMPILIDLPPNAGGDTEVILSDVAIVKIDATQGTATTYGSLHEVPNGTITTFTNEAGFYEPGSVELYLGTQKQGKGIDYTESDNTLGQVDFTVAPLEDESIIESYLVSSFKADWIYATSALDNANNKVAGLINGSNKLFTIAPYKSGTLKVFIQGMIQTQGSAEDWVETDPTAGTFTMAVAPLTGEVVSTSSEPANSSRRYANTNDDLTYTFDGSNTRGTTPDAYEQNSLELSWNGQLRTPGTDFVETNPTTGDFDTIIGLPTGILQAAYDVGTNSVAVGERTLSLSKTGTYQMLVTDRGVDADTTSGAFTVTPPAVADTDGMEFNIVKIDSSLNALTIGATINGVVNPVITRQYDSYTFRSNGTEYFLV